jgi:predicted AlkP superfamily pyrophosphatase or phosphodiesterase
MIRGLVSAAVVLVSIQVASPRTIADHVLIIGIDGLGSEGLRRARAPVIRGLMADGASTLAARAVMPTVSSPNWASMIMGAGPEQHGVTSNEWQPDKFEFPPVVRGTGAMFPTMFGELRRQRPSSSIGVFHDWDGFGRLLETTAPDALVDGDGPAATVDRAVSFIRTRKPALIFVHLDHVDHAGHELGWVSDAYMAAIEDADRLVGQLLTALDETAQRARTIVMLSADHGGVGTRHGGLSVAEIEIPWIINGPTIRRGHTIDVPVSTTDTAPTALYVLGASPHAAWTGRPVLDALQSQPRGSKR